MRRMSHALLFAGLVLGMMSCRASFEDMKKAKLFSSGDELGAKSDEGKTSNVVPEDFPTLTNTKELPQEDSESYGCDGIVFIHEKGKDKNRDGILQPTEVTEITTECKPKTNPPGGKDPDQPVPPKCPNQSKDPNDKCDDDPNQSGKK